MKLVVWFVLLLSCAAVLHADNVLLHNGGTLFNVSVDDSGSTWTRPLHVRYKPSSFRYDFDRHSVQALLGRGEYYYVADYVTTAAEMSKQTAREFILESNWHRYVMPPPVILTPIPIAPRNTPAPPPQATATPDTGTTVGLVDPLLPLDQRIQAQLELFITEQRNLVDLIKYSVQAGTLTEDQGRAHRQSLLEKQLELLEKNYPSEHELVSRAKEALHHQLGVVKNQGKFSFEE